MNKWIELLLGLILVIGAILAGYYLHLGIFNAAWVVLKGGIFWAVIGIGFLLILLGISDLRS